MVIIAFAHTEDTGTGSKTAGTLVALTGVDAPCVPVLLRPLDEHPTNATQTATTTTERRLEVGTRCAAIVEAVPPLGHRRRGSNPPCTTCRRPANRRPRV